VAHESRRSRRLRPRRRLAAQGGHVSFEGSMSRRNGDDHLADTWHGGRRSQHVRQTRAKRSRTPNVEYQRRILGQVEDWSDPSSAAAGGSRKQPIGAHQDVAFDLGEHVAAVLQPIDGDAMTRACGLGSGARLTAQQIPHPVRLHRW
jgi:hypothetical protein